MLGQEYFFFINASLFFNGTLVPLSYACRSNIVNLGAPDKPLTCPIFGHTGPGAPAISLHEPQPNYSQPDPAHDETVGIARGMEPGTAGVEATEGQI